jgi:protein Mpv17
MNHARNLSRLFIQKAQKITRTLFSPKYLLATNIGVGVLTGGTGVTVQQSIDYVTTRGKKEVSWSKIRNYIFLCFTVTPPLHYWYIWLDRVLPPGKTPRMVVIKVLLDALIAQSLLAVYFLGGTVIMENDISINSLKDAKNAIVKSGLQLYTGSLMINQTGMAVNFYLVPTRFRLLFVNLVFMCSDIFTASILYSDDDKCSENFETEKSTSIEGEL